MTEPLVLLPAMMCDARLFVPQIAALSAQRSVTVAHLGQADRIEDIAAALLADLPPRFALAGLGLGGIVALEMIRAAPERITRLALISTSPSPESPQFAAAREPRIIAAQSGRLADCLREDLPGSALAAGPARAGVLALVMAMGLALGPQVYVRQTRALQRRRDAQSTLRRIRVPALIVAGEHDTIVPLRRQEFIAEMIADARIVVLPGSGHLPTLEQPDAVTEALRRWLTPPLVLR